MMKSIRDQMRSRNGILVPQVYTIVNSIPLLMVYVMYYEPNNISSTNSLSN
jgi:hypothetical protein